MSDKVSEYQAIANRIRERSFLPLAKITIISVGEEGTWIELRNSRYLLSPDWTPRIGVKSPYILRTQSNLR